MSSADLQKQLDVLVEVSRRLQDSAEAGDWEAVNHLQEKCQRLAGELFAEVIAAADAPAVTTAINEVLKINKCVVDMGMETRDVCLRELDQFQQGRRAVKEYSANTR